MNDQKPDETKLLGVLRICVLVPSPVAAFFDLPYYNEDDFDKLIASIVEKNCWNNGFVWLPYHGIGAVMKIPEIVFKTASASAESKEAQKLGELQ